MNPIKKQQIVDRFGNYFTAIKKCNDDETDFIVRIGKHDFIFIIDAACYVLLNSPLLSHVYVYEFYSCNDETNDDDYQMLNLIFEGLSVLSPKNFLNLLHFTKWYMLSENDNWSVYAKEQSEALDEQLAPNFKRRAEASKDLDKRVRNLNH